LAPDASRKCVMRSADFGPMPGSLPSSSINRPMAPVGCVLATNPNLLKPAGEVLRTRAGSEYLTRGLVVS
jgi:hypothetical protein